MIRVWSEHCDRTRRPDTIVRGHQPEAMNERRGRDELVGQITMEPWAEPGALQRDATIERQHGNTWIGLDACEEGIRGGGEDQALVLAQLRDLPQADRRDPEGFAVRLRGQERRLLRGRQLMPSSIFRAPRPRCPFMPTPWH